MGKTEITIFLILSSIILIIFITGIILFVLQYRTRRIKHEKEKEKIEKQYKIDLMDSQLQSQQQTMQHIGQEIHDSVAQKLTLASIYAQRMTFENSDPGNTEKLEGISKIINDSLLELRQLSKSLTDSKIQNAGLAELVRMECDQVNATGICASKLEVADLPETDITVKSSILRIVQEFIQNSIKHSGCKIISIQMKQATGVFAITLEDDGRGFDMESVQHKGIGLDSIRRRILMLGGTCTFQSKINAGTTLHLVIPLKTINTGHL